MRLGPSPPTGPRSPRHSAVSRETSDGGRRCARERSHRSAPDVTSVVPTELVHGLDPPRAPPRDGISEVTHTRLASSVGSIAPCLERSHRAGARAPSCLKELALVKGPTQLEVRSGMLSPPPVDRVSTILEIHGFRSSVVPEPSELRPGVSRTPPRAWRLRSDRPAGWAACARCLVIDEIDVLATPPPW